MTVSDGPQESNLLIEWLSWACKHLEDSCVCYHKGGWEENAPKGLQIWWNKQKTSESERLAGIKASALEKLTEEEKKVLGLTNENS